MDTQRLCKNCGYEDLQQYCPACGQKRIEERWNLKTLLRSAFTTIFNIEKGFFYTFRELFLHPGKVVGEYLDGRTMPYTNPFRYLVVAIAVSVFLMLSLGVWELQMDNIIEAYKKINFISSAEDELRMRKSMGAVTKFMNLMPLLLLPFIALASRLFIGKKLYYAEHFIMVSFLTAQSTLYGVFITIITYFFPELISWVFLLGLILATTVFGQTFHEFFKKSWMESLLLGLATYLVGFLFFFLFTAIASIIVTIIVLLVVKLAKG